MQDSKEHVQWRIIYYEQFNSKLKEDVQETEKEGKMTTNFLHKRIANHIDDAEDRIKKVIKKLEGH